MLIFSHLFHNVLLGINVDNNIGIVVKKQIEPLFIILLPAAYWLVLYLIIVSTHIMGQQAAFDLWASHVFTLLISGL